MRILSLDGGGYLGLATAALIRDAEQYHGVRFHDAFDMFCGTSTGAIIALALARGKTGDEVVELYKSFGPAIFGRGYRSHRAFSWLRWWVTSKYGNTPLRRALEGAFGTATLGDIHACKKRVLVTAFSVLTGAPKILKTDHSDRLARDNRLLLTDVALASAAAPSYLPLVRMKSAPDDVLCDGGVASNHPALLGYAEALAELAIPPHEIRLLSISTPRSSLGEARVKRLRRGKLGWASKLPDVLINANSFLSEEVLRRLVASHPEPRPRYERIRLTNDARIPLDHADRLTTHALEQLGATVASSQDVREQISAILHGTKGTSARG